MPRTTIHTDRSAKPFEIRDFSKGRIAKYSVNNFIVPKNSVSDSINVNYDTIIGSGVVRLGTTLLGSTVASGKTPLGLGQFVGPGGSPNLQLSVFTGASTATLYYYDTSWHASGLTALSNTRKVRFATLGGSAFVANGVDAMKSSTDGSTWVTTNCITTDSVIPSLVLRTKQRMLAGGYSGKRDRVYFSSIIDPTASPFITWNTNGTTGDWIDINPDDGGNVTGFAETSNQVLVFKSNGMYRIDVVNKNVDSQNIFNVGAVSQEAMTSCQGLVYFFSGIGAHRTDGTYPVQISRLGVQDYFDAIPQANWSTVAVGNDGWNVYFSIGAITLNTGRDNQRTYSNVVLKFSVRDETWSVHSYGDLPYFYSQFTSATNGFKMISADTTGNVQTVNSGYTDNTKTIFYELETQEQEIGNRAHSDKVTDNIGVFTTNGIDSKIQVKADVGDYINIDLSLSDRVNVGDGIDIEGHYLTFKWSGSSSGPSPVFDGLYIENITNNGLVPNK